MDNEVDIVIRTRAELEGVKALKKELEEQIRASKALGKDYSGLTNQLSQVNQAISKAVPEFSAFGRILSTLRGGPITAVTAGFLYLGKAILDATTHLFAFGEATEEQGKAAAQTKTSLNKYKESIDQVKGAAAEAEAKLDGLKSAMTALKEAQDQIAAAVTEREKAEIDAAVSGGTMSKEEGEVRKAAIEGRSIQAGAARQRAFIGSQEQFAAAEMNVKDFAAIVARQQAEGFAKEAGLDGRNIDVEALARQAQKDEDDLKKAQVQQKELQERVSKIGLLAMPATNIQGIEDVAALEGLTGAIPKLETVAGQSAARAADAARLQAMRKTAEAAEAEARLGRTRFEGQRQVFGAQRSALDRTVPERLTTIGLQAGAGALGGLNQQAEAQAQQILKEAKLGMSGAAQGGSAVVSAIQSNTQATLQAYAAMVRELNVQNAAIKQLQQQISRLQFPY